MKTEAEPRLGLFWFVPDMTAGFVMKGASHPSSQIPLIGGFRTLEIGHISVWKTIIIERPDLRSFGYEYFPRGRVNWIEDGDVYLLLVDSFIIERKLASQVIDAWDLPVERTRVMTDAHYRTHNLTTIITD